jgi:hypothetical protein
MGVLPARMGDTTLGRRQAHRYGAKPHLGAKKGKRGVTGLSVWNARGQIVRRGEGDLCLASRSRFSLLEGTPGSDGFAQRPRRLVSVASAGNPWAGSRAADYSFRFTSGHPPAVLQICQPAAI